ncbi:MAG: hypothetical protein HZB38_10350 [Planctomycetes bacterium]|nr:hypothetical protein [Planctomycetota bacterium]
MKNEGSARMRNNWVYRWAFLFAACGVPTIRAEISFTLDKLDASDGLPLPPPNIVIVDLRVDVSPGDAWSGTGLEGRSFAGAEIEYAYDELGYPLGTAPGVDNRFVTFLSRPRARNNDARFGVGAAVTLLSYSYEVIVSCDRRSAPGAGSFQRFRPRLPNRLG